MPSSTPLTDAINALTTYTNETTGASDTNLSDAVRTLVDGYGQGGSATRETGAIVPANNESLTIPVSALYSHIYVYLDGFSWDMSLSKNPYGAHTRLCIYADNNYGFIAQEKTNYAGTNMDGEVLCIGGWGNNTNTANQVKFYEDNITMSRLRLGGVIRNFVSGATYNWVAW